MRSVLFYIRLYSLCINGCIDHQDMPFEELVRRLNIDRSTGAHPVFQTVFTHDIVKNGFEGEYVRKSSFLEPAVDIIESHISKFDLAIGVRSNGDNANMEVVVEFSKDLFDVETIERVLASFLEIIAEITRDSSMQVSKINAFSSINERMLVLEHWSRNSDGGSTSIPLKCTHELFVEQACLQPESPALIFNGGAGRLTYEALRSHSHRLSHLLRERLDGCFGSQPIIGICTLQSSWIMVASMLAVWMAGCAYVPLDSKLPAQRLRHMIEDAGVRLIICQRSLENHIHELDICYDAGKKFQVEIVDDEFSILFPVVAFDYLVMFLFN